MLAWLIGGACAAIGLGVVLYALGRRGRKINDHPQCTWCRADLVGQAKLETCEACGAGLTRAGAVRQGVRVRRRGMILGGVGFGAVGVVAGVLALVLLAAPDVILRRLPARALVAMPDSPRFQAAGKDGGPARGLSALAQELLRRVKAGDAALVKARPGELIARVTREQLRDDVPWDPAWGDIVVELIKLKAIDEEQIAMSALAGTRVRIETRSRAAKGEPMPIKMTPVAERMSSEFGYRGTVQLKTVRVGGKLVDLRPVPQRRGSTTIYVSDDENRSRPTEIGKSRGWGFARDNEAPYIVRRLAVDVPAGEHEIEVVARIGFEALYNDDQPSSMVVFHARDLNFTRKVLLVEDRADSLPKRVLTDAQREELRAALAKSTVKVQRFELKTPMSDALRSLNVQSLIRVDVNPPKLSRELHSAFRIAMLVGDQKVVVGELGYVSPRERLNAGAFGGDGLKRLLVEAPIKGVDKVTLIFTPDIEAALEEIKLDEYIAEEFRIENVPVEWIDPGTLEVELRGENSMVLRFKTSRTGHTEGGSPYDFLKRYGWTLEPSSRFDTD